MAETNTPTEKTFSETMREKRAQMADEYKETQQIARLVMAINRQTEVLGGKMDEILTFLKSQVKEEETEENPPETMTS